MKQNISAKELRLKLPQILKAVKEQGKRFTIIHRSQVVADIGPVGSGLDTDDADHPFNLFVKDHPQLHLRSKKSAVQLVRELRD